MLKSLLNYSVGQNIAIFALLAILLSGCTISSEPFTADEIEAQVNNDLYQMFSAQEDINKAITLEEAIARALLHNLDYRLKLMEKAVAMSEVDLSHYNLLPKITADAGYKYRTSEDGTSINGSSSITSERSHITANLDVTWNVLDFGISYIRGKQQLDLALIVEERRRQVVHNIVKEVRAAFWRVVAVEQSLPELNILMGQVDGALASSEQLMEEGLGNRSDHLVYQRELLETLSQLEVTKRDMLAARVNLAALMNVRPDSHFTLAVDNETKWLPLLFPFSIDEAEHLALRQRTELRAEAYQTRVYARESKVAILRMLPGLSFTGGINYDSDYNLINSNWGSMGIPLTWNLMHIFKLQASLDLAKKQVKLSDVRRMALSMAILSQVQVAGLRYNSAIHELGLSSRQFNVEDQIQQQSYAEQQAQKGGELAQIRDTVRTLQARLRRDLAYANLQDAYGSLFATIGLDPLPSMMTNHSLDAVKEELKRTFTKWQRGIASDLI